MKRAAPISPGQTSRQSQSRRTPTAAPVGVRRDWLMVAAAMFGVGWGANQFASMLVAYHRYLGLTIRTNEVLLVIYALGLVPALLLGGPASDRWGRSVVIRPAAIVSLVATLMLVVGSHSVLMLGAGLHRDL